MKKIFLLIVGLAAAIAAEAQDFSTHFHNKTLRIDYHFVGNAEQQIVALDELASVTTPTPPPCASTSA